MRKLIRGMIKLTLMLGIGLFALAAYVGETSTGPERAQYEKSKSEVATQWRRLMRAFNGESLD